MEFVKIEVNRNGYSPKQCGDTVTVSELISILEQFEDDMPVYLSNDDGYTYGNINEWDISSTDSDDEY